MTENDSQQGKPSPNDDVQVTDWTTCYNANDNVMVLSCTLTSSNSSGGISGVGLILNTSAGSTLASTYTALSSPSKTVYPALNLAPGPLSVGDSVEAVAQGQCDGKHFFFEQRLTIKEC